MYLKQCFAEFLTSSVFKTPISETDVVVVAGSGAVMDIMGTTFLDPATDSHPSDAFICMYFCLGVIYVSLHPTTLLGITSRFVTEV